MQLGSRYSRRSNTNLQRFAAFAFFTLEMHCFVWQKLVEAGCFVCVEYVIRMVRIHHFPKLVFPPRGCCCFVCRLLLTARSLPGDNISLTKTVEPAKRCFKVCDIQNCSKLSRVLGHGARHGHVLRSYIFEPRQHRRVYLLVVTKPQPLSRGGKLRLHLELYFIYLQYCQSLLRP